MSSSLGRVSIEGQALSRAQVAARLQEVLDTGDAIRAQRQALQRAVAERDAQLAEWRNFYADVVLFLRQHYGRQGQELPRFGIALPRPRAPMSTEVRAIASAKRAAKRARLQALREPAPRVVVLGADGHPLGEPPAANDAPAAPTPAANTGK